MSAQVIVLNTCSIRDHAEQKVYSYLGPHAVRTREESSRGSDFRTRARLPPRFTIAVLGCRRLHTPLSAQFEHDVLSSSRTMP
eukprot:3122255-Pleurochrysis_carterae.AAC.3